MKTPIKKLTRIGTLFIGISLMLTLANCQKEEISDIKETTTANRGTETARTQNRTKGDFVTYIDTTSIKAITNGEMGTFTMPVVTRDHNKDFFTNIVLSKKRTENDWRYTFVRYWPTRYWSNLNDQSDEAPPFDGKIEIMDEHGDVKMSAQFENGISIDPKADFGLEYAPFTYRSGGGCSCSSGGGLSFLTAAWGAISEAVSTGLNWLGDFFSDLGNGGGGNGNGGPSFYGGYYGYQTSGYDYSTPYIPSGGGGSGNPSIPYTITNPDTGEGLINQWLPDITPEQLNLLIANTTPDGTSLFAMAVGYLSQGGGSASFITSRVLNSECLSLNDKTQILIYLNENNVPVPDDPTGELNFSEQETFVQEVINAICEGEVDSFDIAIFIAEQNCQTTGSEQGWDDNLEENEEPKWGQLANKQEILDEIASIPDLSLMTYEQQVTALANHFEKNLMYNRDNDGNLYIVDSNDDVNRYIYSQIGGWIDFHHVFKIFEWAMENGPFYAITAGEMGEVWQDLKDNYSAYSYEDLPSNLLGVGMFVRFSQDIALGNITWYQAVYITLNELDCVKPEQAPNFLYIPHIVNEHYPQNYTYTPLLGEDLENYHREKFCGRPYEEQVNIKEAHEQFER